MRSQRQLDRVLQEIEQTPGIVLYTVVNPELTAELERRCREMKLPCLHVLEPIMKVEVTSPEEYVGSVIGDLNSRRGMIQGQDMRGNATIINAMVPLANMFGYVNTLRSFSQGRASYVMEFDHYEEVPKAVSAEYLPPTFGSALNTR